MSCVSLVAEAKACLAPVRTFVAGIDFQKPATLRPAGEKLSTLVKCLRAAALAGGKAAGGAAVKAAVLKAVATLDGLETAAQKGKGAAARKLSDHLRRIADTVGATLHGMPGPDLLKKALATGLATFVREAKGCLRPIAEYVLSAPFASLALDRIKVELPAKIRTATACLREAAQAAAKTAIAGLKEALEDAIETFERSVRRGAEKLRAFVEKFRGKLVGLSRLSTEVAAKAHKEGAAAFTAAAKKCLRRFTPDLAKSLPEVVGCIVDAGKSAFQAETRGPKAAP